MWWSVVLAACGAPQVDEVSVVVAARDLSVGVPIEGTDVVLVMMRPELVPDGVFFAPTDVVGRVPFERILANEPIRGGRLADPELQARLEAIVPRGLEVTTVSLAPGALPPTPGRDRVDVHAPDGGLVAAGVQVHRVDRDRVALMATPEQIEALRQAHGDLTATVSAPEAP